LGSQRPDVGGGDAPLATPTALTPRRRACYHRPMPIRAAILTVSDAGSRGERADTSGPAIRELLATIDATVERYEIVPDERQQIAATLAAWCDEGGLDLLLTTGGTGLAARDVTPEATLDIAHRLVPGIAEAMRAEGMRHTPRAMLSRGVAVTRGGTLIVNLPGSEKAVRESLSAVLGVLPHAVELLAGVTEHPKSSH
jgi:molybdopterin adenylyltransferase